MKKLLALCILSAAASTGCASFCGNSDFTPGRVNCLRLAPSGALEKVPAPRAAPPKQKGAAKK